MGEVAAAWVSIVPSMRDFGKTVTAETTKAGDLAGQQSGKRFSSKFRLAAGAALAAGLGAALKTGFGEVMDYQTGLSQLTAGLKSTHDVSNTTAGGLEKLASSIQDYSGQTDDSIVGAEQLLLTFTNLRNEAGKGNDVFNQTTKIAADMAARLGGDAASKATLLGKALNDPAKGLSALTRVGVTFTDQQKKQIAALDASGDRLGAQKVILAELNKEFGGSAKTFGQTVPGQIQRLHRSWEDMTQQLATALLPALQKVVGGLSGLLDFIKQNQTWLVPFAAAVGGLAATVYTIVKAVKIWTEVQAALNLVMEANPIVLIGTALVALAAGLVIAYKKSETFRDIVNGALSAVAGVFKRLWDIGKTVLDFLKDHWKTVATVIATVIGGPIVGAITLLITHFNTVKRVAGEVWHGIRDAFGHVVDFVSGLPGKIAHAAAGMWDGIKDAFRAVINTIIGWWDSFASHLKIPAFKIPIPFAPDFHFGGLDVGAGLQIPKLAAGGIITRPTLALVGEGPEPEAVVPLSRIGQVASRARTSSPAGDPLLAELRALRRDTVTRLTSLENAVYGVGGDTAHALNSATGNAARKGRAHAAC